MKENKTNFTHFIDNDGTLSKSGIKSYEKLINILYNLSYITDKITPTQIESIIQDLDKIENE